MRRPQDSAFCPTPRSRRQLLQDPALCLDREQQGNEPTDERDRCERREYVLDSQIGNDRADQDRADRRSRPEPCTAKASTDRAKAGWVKLSRVEIQGERDGLQNGVGGGCKNQHLNRRGSADPGKSHERRSRDKKCNRVPTLSADLIDQKGTRDGRDHPNAGRDPTISQARLQRQMKDLLVK